MRHVGLTDRLLEGALKNLIENARKVLDNPRDYNVRSEIMWIGSVAHNNLLNTGRIGDWASHMIEHELSAINDVAHGAGLSIIFPAWMKYVYKTDLDLFVQYAVRVWNVEENYFDREETAKEGIRCLEEFYQSLHLPTRLHEIEIGEESFELIAKKCRKFDKEKGTVGNFLPLGEEDIVEILKLAK